MHNNSDDIYVWREENPAHFLYNFLKREDIRQARYKVFRRNGKDLIFHKNEEGMPIPETWGELKKYLDDKPYLAIMISACIEDKEDLILTNNCGTDMIVTTCRGTYSKEQLKNLIKRK